MMQIRCQRCGWNFTLGRDTIGLAIAEANQGHLEYYQFVCPNCRHEVKVQVEVLRRHLPMDYVLPIPQPKPERVVMHKEELKPEAVAVPKPAAPAVSKPVGPAEPIEPVKAARAATKKPAVGKKAAEKKSIGKKPAAAKLAPKKSAAKKSTAKKSKK